jgi:hypothetical protein
MSSDTDNAVPAAAKPTEEELREAIRLVRTSGLTDPAKPLTEHQALLYAARHLSSEPDDAAKIKDILSKAIEQAGGEHTEAMRALFGLTDALSGRSVGIRRKQAMRLSGHGDGDPESFRKHTERDWLDKIVYWLSFSLTNLADRALAADLPADSSPHGKPAQNDESRRDHGLGAVDEQSRVPTLPEPDPKPPAHQQTADAGRFRPRRALALVAVVGVAAVGAVVALMADHGSNSAGAVSGRCGPTTVQLLKYPQSEILVYAPNLEGWTFYIPLPPNESEKSEIFRYGEVRQFALDATDETPEAEHGFIARVGLPRSATLEPNSTCVYRSGNYASGARYAGTSLSAPSGIKIGSVAPHQWVYVTFKERLPTVGQTGNTATTYGAIASASKIGGPEWTEKASHLELELTGGA